MYYKQYGDTDMKVSAVGMGCMRYNDEDVKAGRFEKCAETALYAHEKGINYFDTAPFYCDDKSEIITGIALSQIPRDSFYISSKTNISVLERKATRDMFRKRLELTLERLHVDYLDFYHLWCILNMDSFEAQCESLYGFYEEAKKEGLIRNIVFSSHMQGDQLADAIAADRFKGMLIGYNALNYRFRQSGIKAAYQKGMGVVVMNPLGGGLIPQNPKTFEYLTAETDLSVAQAALNFVASHKEITVTLAGCTTKAHVEDACKAVEQLVERPVDEIVNAFEHQGAAINDLCTGCSYCDKCPKGIAIPKYMDTYNLKLLGGNKNGMLDRLSGHWNIGNAKLKECISCGKCEDLCTQHLPIIERLKEMAEF